LAVKALSRINRQDAKSAKNFAKQNSFQDIKPDVWSRNETADGRRFLLDPSACIGGSNKLAALFESHCMNRRQV